MFLNGTRTRNVESSIQLSVLGTFYDFYAYLIYGANVAETLTFCIFSVCHGFHVSQITIYCT